MQLIRDTSTRGKGGQASRAGRLRASYLYGGRGQFSVVCVQFLGREEVDSRRLKGEEWRKLAPADCEAQQSRASANLKLK
ncbi:MAG: hypothetical protein DMG50_19590 [Acidobacteria bacterium]|nr:MAG: hypothetical protein DMG50_19590 [Acidobacteriota bacterium]